jgi:hypothetical protein
VEPTDPPTEEHQPQEPTNRDNVDDTPNQQGWWDNTDVSGLIDPEAFCRFLYSCNQLLENSDSDSDDDEAIPRVSGTNTELSPDKQPKLRQSPPMKE